MTFGPNLLVASGACPCCRPRLAVAANGDVYVFWRRVFPGQIRDIVASVSNDNGATFAAPVRVAGDNWHINGCPESGPAASVLGGRVYVSWMTETNQERAGVKLSWTDDGGKSFAPALVVSQTILDANHPSFAAADDSRLLLAFQGRDPSKHVGWSSVEPYLVEISGSGAISRPVPISSSATTSASYPVAAWGGAGRGFFSWTGTRGEGKQIQLIRGRRVQSR